MEKLLSELVELGKTEKFNGEIDYGEKIDSNSLFEVMREVGMDEKSAQIIENRFLETAPLIQNTLLAVSFASFLKSSDDLEALKKSRRCVRLLLNLVQRSSKFAARTSSECVELLETLLATSSVTPEILLFLVKTADSTWLEFQKSPRYTPLLERILTSPEADSTDSLAYFSILLEKDYGFLANCYAEMAPSTFCALLDILRCLQERSGLKIHSNNLLFVLNLLELIVVDYGAFLVVKVKKEPKSVEQRRRATIEMLNLLVEIVGDMCTNTEMTSHLNEKATILNAVVDILDTILHSEALFADFRESQGENWPELPPDEPKFAILRQKIEEERKYEKLKRAQVDRPKQPPPARIPRVETSESLSQLAELILERYKTIGEDYHQMGELKLNCLKAIANLCSLSGSNKLATVENGRMALLSVLQCTTRRPAYFLESYAMRNWCIFCVRQLTDECQENKEVILRLGEPTQPIIDRKRLLREFGLEDVDLDAPRPPNC